MESCKMPSICTTVIEYDAFKFCLIYRMPCCLIPIYCKAVLHCVGVIQFIHL